jgi:hypothetical protein
MRPMRTILFSVVLTLVVFSTVTYTACTKKNHCLNVVCANGGLCDGGNCQCLVGYEGSRCEILSRDKFVNTYNGNDLCGNFNGHTYDQYPIRLFVVRTDSIELLMQNILNNSQDSAICTMVASDSFNFQGVNNSTTYYGYGKLRNDSLWLNYHVQHDTSSYNCHYFGIGLH